MRRFLSLSSTFSAGFGLSYYLFRRDNVSVQTDGALFTTLMPTLRAEAPPPPSDIVIGKQDNSIVPIKPGSKDTLSITGPSRIAEIMKHGYPSLDNLRIFENYVLSYDRRNRVANWVFERLTSAGLKPAENVDRGKSEFKEDAQLHTYFRSTNQDYKGSGYDRGHLAAAANHRSNQKHMDDTFYLCNMAPQVGEGFNRDKWNELEKHVRGLVKKYDNVWVVTGPLYLPRRESDNKLYVKYEVIGAHNVAVPTHFFKVVLGESPNGTYDLFSYVLPNAYCHKDIPLESYLVPVDSIERAGGFLLFDRLMKSKIKLINGKKA